MKNGQSEFGKDFDNYKVKKIEELKHDIDYHQKKLDESIMLLKIMEA